VKIAVVAGPPSVGKTAVLLHTIPHLTTNPREVAIVKFDCLKTRDDYIYRNAGFPTVVGLSQNVCPDHYLVINLEPVFHWAQQHHAQYLLIETAGLCLRCAPYVDAILGVCVIDNLSGVYTPEKLGPMLTKADIVVVTKGDFVSHAEREVFQVNIERINPTCTVLPINGLTGQGAYVLAQRIKTSQDIAQLHGALLRTEMPAGVCSYCTGELRIGEEFESGNIEKMAIPSMEGEPHD